MSFSDWNHIRGPFLSNPRSGFLWQNMRRVKLKINDQIEFQNTSAGPQLIGLNPPDALKYATAS